MHSPEGPNTNRNSRLIMVLLATSKLKQVLTLLVLSGALAGCAQLSIRPQPIHPSDSPAAARAIEAEPIPPAEVLVRNFEVSPSAVKENASPLHRLINLFRRESADERRLEIGRGAATSLSEQTVKRLHKFGLQASLITNTDSASSTKDVLLVTGRVLDANEGNRLTRIALGCGAGESSLDTEVHVFRVAYGEPAEVLAFTTHADSGKMPGVLPSLGAGEFLLGTITILAKAKGVVSSGEKIYSSQIDHLAIKSGDEVVRYISQYAAQEGWIPRKDAKSVKLAAN